MEIFGKIISKMMLEMISSYYNKIINKGDVFMNDLMVFNNVEFGEIRVVNINNEPYFIGKDVAGALQYKNTRDALIKHVDDEDKADVVVYDGRQNRKMVAINESGVYSLIFGSKLESAKKFKRWVTSEVLVQIRQTGGYIPVKETDSDEEILAKALLIANRTLEKKDKLIAEMTPKASWFDEFINSDGLYTSTQVAKMLGFHSAQELNKKLNEMKIIYKQNKSWLPYADVDTTWFKLLVGAKNEHNYSSLKFTAKGIVEISNRLNIDLNEKDLKEFN